ncbi:nucleoside monophosphate kinase [Candidatus Saccharibacteria bacterium]|nr:nucleoside monophosphate kinase [Candidatus Saccharibacteria bacterium]
MRIIFLGGPGSGKSTVGNRLAEDFNWPWISSGEILRESKEPWVVERLKTAALFDDEMVAGLVFSRLHGVKDAILDGFPRTLKQAEIMIERGEEINVVVELVVPLEEIQKRLFLRGREQDTKEIAEERYNDYERTKTELIAYLVGNGSKILTIDGVGTQDEVYNRVIEGIREVIKK